MKKNMILLLMVLIGITAYFVVNNDRKKANLPQKQKVTVLLDWIPNTNHTGLYVARDKGFYDKQNLDVEIIQPGEGDSGQIVASGKANFGISSQEAVTLAREQGVPLVSLAAILQHNSSAFASLKESGIETVNDFENKRYGGWGSPIEKAVIESVMSDVGADYNKVTQITIGTTDFFTTIGRDSDFQWIFYGWDGIEAKRRGKELNVILLKDLNPVLDYYTPVIVTNEKHITADKELISKFMKATAEGYVYAANNPEASSEILLKNAPELNKELVKQSQLWVSKKYIDDAPKWGVQKADVWKRYTDWLFEHNQLKKTIDSQKAFTNEFL